MLGLRFCARAFSSCGERGPLFIAVRGPLIIAASLVAEHRLQTRRLSSCGSWAQLLRGMWDLPKPGLEPVSPALAGGFLTTAPPGKALKCNFLITEWILPLGRGLFANAPGSTWQDALPREAEPNQCLWLWQTQCPVQTGTWAQRRAPRGRAEAPWGRSPPAHQLPSIPPTPGGPSGHAPKAGN